ncbi:MAG TPA: metallophosphoesterase [Chloroflexota bacterium]|nr:metallophosphoesterase [Chloroflexota bacterium]
MVTSLNPQPAVEGALAERTAVRRPVRVVATADNHLSRGHARMSPQRLEKRRWWLRQGFRRAVDYALESRADLFLQAGDLFDSPQPRNVDRSFVANELRRLQAAGIPAFGIAGTHDSPKMQTVEGGWTPQRIYQQFDALHVFSEFQDPTAMLLDVDGTSVAIGGISVDPLLGVGDDPLAGVGFPRQADVGILLLHYGVEGAAYANASEPVVARSSISALEGVDLLVAGHYHEFHQFSVGPVKVVVPGATERMIYGAERDASFAYIELLPGRADRVQKVVVDGQGYRQVTLRTTELDLAQPFESALGRLEPALDAETVVKVRLEGPVTREQYRALRVRELLRAGISRCFHFEVDTSGLTLAEDRPNGVGKGLRLSQKQELQLAAQQLMADEPEHAPLLRQAVQELMRAYD